MSFPLPHLEVLGTPVTPPKDQDTPDTHIYKSFAKRRMSLDMGSPIQEICKSLHMFEQFLIIGVPPKSETPKPQILAMYPSTQYPQSDKDLDNLISFCFPGKLSKASDASILAEEFVFYMHNEKKERSYGVCVHVRPPVDSPPFFADRTNRDWPFCLCLLTRQPFFCAHFQFLSYLAMALCGKVQCSLKRMERTPVSVKGFCHRTLSLDKTSPALAVWPKTRAPPLLIDSLVHYHAFPVTPQLSPFVDNSLCATMPIVAPLHLSITQNVSFPTLDVLFSFVDLETIVQLYTAMLLERRILFISESPMKASLSVMALTSLMNPFHSSALIMPVVPGSGYFATLLDSPIPYIAGCSQATLNADITVDIDTGVVTTMNQIPELPRAQELLKKLKHLLDDNSSHIAVPPMEQRSFFGRIDRNPEFDKFIKSTNPFNIPQQFLLGHPQKYIFTTELVDSIRTVFAVHIPVVLIEKMKSYYVRDATNKEQVIAVLNKPLFLSQFSGVEAQFYRQFSGTQVFYDFTNRGAKEFEALSRPQIARPTSLEYIRSPTKILSPFQIERDTPDPLR